MTARVDELLHEVERSRPRRARLVARDEPREPIAPQAEA